MENKNLKRLISTLISITLISQNLFNFGINQASATNPPTASNVAVTGTSVIGSSLNGSYTFNDSDPGDIQSGTQYQWSKSSSENGSYTNITGETNQTYTLSGSDKNMYLKFSVTPVSNNIPNTGSIASSTGFWIDGTAPTGGSFTINNGDVSTLISGIQLDIVCSTDSDNEPVDFAFGNTTTPTNWSLCSGTESTVHDLDIGGGDGVKFVYVRFRDNVGNISNAISRIIQYDTTPPSGQAITNLDGYQSSTQIDVGIDRGSDSLSGMSEDDIDYLLEYRRATLAGETCGAYGSLNGGGVTETANSTGFTFNGLDGYCYKFSYWTKDKAGNQIRFDGTNETRISTEVPTISCTISEGTNTGYQLAGNDNIYYNSNFSGDFNIQITGNASIGIKSINFPTLGAGFSGGGDCLSGSCSQNYSWTAGASPTIEANTGTVTASNDLETNCIFDVIDDNTSPTAGSINYQTEYRNLTGSMFPTMTVDDGIDAGGAGIDQSSRIMQRSTGTLLGNVCLSYGSFTDSTYGLSYPNIQDNAGIDHATCYKYQWIIKDNVGNESIYADLQGDQYKIDVNKPVVYVNNMTGVSANLFYKSSEKELYYKETGSDKDFTVNVFARDPDSEMNNIKYPYLGAGFSTGGSMPGTTGIYLYDYDYTISSGTTLTTGEKKVIGENNAALSESGSFNVIIDNDSPINVSITCESDYNIDGNFTVTGSFGTDAGAGINANETYMQISNGSLIGNECTGTSAFANIGTSKATDLIQTGLPTGCYLYRYHSEDNVGNVFDTPSCMIKVDLTQPIKPTLGVTENSDYIFYHSTGNTLYYSNQSVSNQNLNIDISTLDSDSEIKLLYGSSAFDDTPSKNNTGITTLEYSIENGKSCSTGITITARNNAGNESGSIINCQEDNIAPSTGSISYTNGYETDTGVVITVDRGSDSYAGMSIYDADYVLEYRESDLNFDICGTFSGSWLDTNVNEQTTETEYLFISNQGTCYQFRYRVKDMVFNEYIITSNDVTKVDTTPPLLSNVATSATSKYVYYSSSSGVFYYNNRNYSDFDILMGSSDPESAISFSSGSTEFGDSPTGTSSTTSPYSLNYSIGTGELCNGSSIEVSLVNKAILSSTGEIVCELDDTDPVKPTFGITETSSHIFYNSTGNTLYYSNWNPDVQDFYIPIETSDGQAGIKNVSGTVAFDDNPTDNTGNTIFNYSIEQSSSCTTTGITITAEDRVGGESSDYFNCVEDNEPSTGWTISYTNGYETDTGIVVTMGIGSDISGMSIYDEDYILEYRKSTLSYDVCDTFSGAWLNAGVNEEDTQTTYTLESVSGNCYQFRYHIKDMVYNELILTGTDITKVDTSNPPLYDLRTSNDSRYVYYGSSSGILYVNNQSASDFEILMGIDPESSTYSSEGSLQFGDTPTGTSSSTVPFSLKYTVGVNEECLGGGGLIDITVVNNALLISNGSISCLKDIIKPRDGSVTNKLGYETGVRMPVGVDRGIDDLSQMSITDEDYTFDYRYKTLTGDICRGEFSPWTGGTTTPSTTGTGDFLLYTGTTVATSTGYNFASISGYCYQFRYNVADNVYNFNTWTGTNITQVDKSTPPSSIVSLVEDSDFLHFDGNNSYVGSNLYYNSKMRKSGQNFAYIVSTEDFESTIESVYGTSDFGQSPIDYTGSYNTGSINGTYSIVYEIGTGQTCDDNNVTINSINKAGLITSFSYGCYDDTTPAIASINIVNIHPYTSNVSLHMTYSDSGIGASGVRDCRVGNDTVNWTQWSPCEASMEWFLTEDYGLKTVYLEVRDNVGNIRRVSDSTEFRNIGSEEYGPRRPVNTGGGGGGGGGGGSSSQISSYTYTDVETKSAIALEKLTNGITNSSIKIENESSNHFAQIARGTQINYSNGKIFNGTILPPTIISRTSIPALLGNISPIRAIKVGSNDGKTLYFSKPVSLTISTKGISGVVDRKGIQIYSYKEDLGKYTLEETNRKINLENETITVDINHMSIFTLIDGIELDTFITTNKIHTPYTDIEIHWSRPYVEELFKKGALIRRSTYNPDQYLNRVELVKIAVESFGKGVSRNLTKEDLKNIDFADTDTNAWYAPYLAQAVRLGLIDKAISKKVNFNYIQYPYDTSSQNNKNLQRMLSFLGYNVPITGDYDDATTNAVKKFQRKYGFRTISGKPGKWTIIYLNAEDDVIYSMTHGGIYRNQFRPGDHVIRAEATKVILKASGINENQHGSYENQFKDILQDSWYEKYIKFAVSKGILKGYPNSTIEPGGHVTRGQMAAISTRTMEIVNEGK